MGEANRRKKTGNNVQQPPSAKEDDGQHDFAHISITAITPLKLDELLEKAGTGTDPVAQARVDAIDGFYHDCAAEPGKRPRCLMCCAEIEQPDVPHNAVFLFVSPHAEGRLTSSAFIICIKCTLSRSKSDIHTSAVKAFGAAHGVSVRSLPEGGRA